MTELQGLGVLHSPLWDGGRRKDGMESCFSNTLLTAVSWSTGVGRIPQRRVCSAQTGVETLVSDGAGLEVGPASPANSHCKSRNHWEKLPWALTANVL